MPPSPVSPVRFGWTRRGLRVVWLPADGATSARLTFRVGTADERLPERGLSHLVQHLARRALDVPAAGAPPAHTGALTTSFAASGTPEQVGERLVALARGLRSVGEATDAEVAAAVEELRAEAGPRAPGPFDHLRTERHGLTGPGLATTAELALYGAAAGVAGTWAERWFTAPNAVLLVVGPEAPLWSVPLLDGEERPVPAPASLPAELPAWTRAPAAPASTTTALTSVTDRSPASDAAWWWLTHLVREELRATAAGAAGGGSTDVTDGDAGDDAGDVDGVELQVRATPLGHGRVELALAAAAPPAAPAERQHAVARAVQAALVTARAVRLGEGDLDRWRTEAGAAWAVRDLPALTAPAACPAASPAATGPSGAELTSAFASVFGPAPAPAPRPLAARPAAAGPAAAQDDDLLDHLDLVARGWLLSGVRRTPDPDPHRADREALPALTPADVHAATTALLDAVVLQLPEGVAGPAGVPATSGTAVPPRPGSTPGGGAPTVPAQPSGGGLRQRLAALAGAPAGPEAALGAAAVLALAGAVALLAGPVLLGGLLLVAGLGAAAAAVAARALATGEEPPATLEALRAVLAGWWAASRTDLVPALRRLREHPSLERAARALREAREGSGGGEAAQQLQA